MKCWSFLVKKHGVVGLIWVLDGVEATDVIVGDDGSTVIIQLFLGKPVSKELLV